MDGDTESGTPGKLEPGEPLLGRDAELSVITKALAEAESGQARVVTVIGAAGVGKSRLAAAALARAPASVRVYRASADPSEQPPGLLVGLLRSRFGITAEMSPETAKSEVRTRVAEVLDDRRVGDICFFLGQLMDLQFFDSPLTKAVGEDAAERRRLAGAILGTFIESDAGQGPLVLFLEDLHLADDGSLTLLAQLTSQLDGRVLVLCTARPELLTRGHIWDPPTSERFQRIDLPPLEDDVARAIIRELLAPCEGSAPERLIDAALEMAGGTPALLERVVDAFLEAGVLVPVDQSSPEPRWRADVARLADARLALTPEEAVEARIGAMAPREREVLEWAAAMGSVFWKGGLLSLARVERTPPEFWRPGPTEEEELKEVLDALVERDHLIRLPDSSFPGDTEYVFRHNLEREKILALTSPSAARRYHQSIASWLASRVDAEAEEEHWAVLAEHLELAGGATRAGLAFLHAADTAHQSFHARAATQYYQKGLDLLGQEEPRRRTDALHDYGDALLVLGKRDEAMAAFRHMLDIAYRLGLTSKGGVAHDRMGRLLRDGGMMREGRQHFDTALALFQSVDDERGVAAVHDDIGRLLWMRGEYRAALEELRLALDLRKKIGDRRSIALSLGNLGRAMLDYGLAPQAREVLSAALTIRREIADPIGIVDSLVDLGRLAQEEADHRQALSLLREAYGVAAEVGERNRMATVLTLIGETHDRLGDALQAIKVLGEAEQVCGELDNKLYLGEARRGLAKVHLKQGDLRKARDAIKSAVDLFGQVRSKPQLAAAVRTLGEVAAAGGWGDAHRAKAVEYFMRSIQLCKEMGNELEVAKSYKAFAQYVKGSDDWQQNPEIQAKATKLDGMAEEIFTKRREELASR